MQNDKFVYTTAQKIEIVRYVYIFAYPKTWHLAPEHKGGLHLGKPSRIWISPNRLYPPQIDPDSLMVEPEGCWMTLRVADRPWKLLNDSGRH